MKTIFNLDAVQVLFEVQPSFKNDTFDKILWSC